MKNTWILVADGSRARLFEIGAPDGALNEVECFSNPEGRAHGRDSTTGRPPSVDESMGATRHTIQPHTTLREKSAERFARALRDALERGRTLHHYEHLVLVAPPRFLGVLHGTFDKPLRDCVVGEVRRDLTAMPPASIRSRLPARLLT